MMQGNKKKKGKNGSFVAEDQVQSHSWAYKVYHNLAPSLCFMLWLPAHTLKKTFLASPGKQNSFFSVPEYFLYTPYHTAFSLFVCISISTPPYTIPCCEFMDSGDHIASLYLQLWALCKSRMDKEHEKTVT